MAKGKVVSNRGKGGFGVKGGSGKMFGKQQANAQVPGVSGHTTSGGAPKFGLQTGSKNHMFGKTGSKAAKSC